MIEPTICRPKCQTEVMLTEWLRSKREEQVRSVIKSTACVYADPQGTVGWSLPELERFSLPGLPVDGNSDFTSRPRPTHAWAASNEGSRP